MANLKNHLRVAVRHLKLEYTELDQALDHAVANAYDRRWIQAIQKELAICLETTLQIQNILTNIRHPAHPPCGLKPGIVQPERT